MPADVNVTEKVARAIDPALYRHISHPTGNAWAVSKKAAAAALAALSDPEVLAGIAGVLREHGCKWSGDNVLSCLCDKGWHGGTRGQRIAQHADHQAAALADWLRGQG